MASFDYYPIASRFNINIMGMPSGNRSPLYDTAYNPYMKQDMPPSVESIC